MRPHALPAVGLLICSIWAAACSGTATPDAPSTSVSRPVAGPSVAQNPAGAFARAGTADLALCLAAPQTPGCFSANRDGVRTGALAVTAPGAPVTLSTTAAGSSVTLTWNAPVSGDPVTTYVIEAGSGPGLANLANFTTNSTATTFSASGVGAGTYYVRVRAQNAGGSGPASNESILVVGSGCTSAPNAPTSLTTTVSGSTVTLAWSAPSGGCPPTSYILQAGSAAGLSNLANANVGNTVSYVASGVGAGIYYVRVLAANPYGQSAASNETALTVGLTITAGTWSYVISADVPLGNQPANPASCKPPNSSGTTVVSSSGAFSIPFSGLACDSCSMSGTITGAIVPAGVSGSVTASISGSGCSEQQPTPSPAAMSGTCTSARCIVSLSAIASFAISYTLTPPLRATAAP